MAGFLMRVSSETKPAIRSAAAPDAVKHQIRFALPETPSGSKWGRHAQTAILNKAAALAAGFIEDKHLPDLSAVGRSPKQKSKQ